MHNKKNSGQDLLEKIANDVGEIKQDVSKLENKFSSLENKVASIESNVSSLENKVASIESNVSSLENKVASIEKEVKIVKKQAKSQYDKLIEKQNIIINFFDRDQKDIKRRVERIEEHLQLSP